jgi:glycosyltransferase involved in cell wall biosynthesis
MADIKDIHLSLFFTKGISLEIWDKTGLLDREIALYKAMLPYLKRITFITYGNRMERRYRKILNGINLICNDFGLPSKFFIKSLPWLHPLTWRGSTIIKSNQIEGAIEGLKVAKKYGKKFIARCGYLRSDFMYRRYGPSSEEFKRAIAMEEDVFRKADRIVVTTDWMKDMVINRYRLAEDRVYVIPNYVDTELFSPRKAPFNDSKKVCFVGRLEAQKNPLALIKAIQDTEVELIVVGDGPLGKDLREFVHSRGLRVKFLGNLPNRELPAIMNSAQLFVLPSLYEGHPKALIEAMACGLPVIGTNVPGIREIINHGETGFLCGTTPREIREAIMFLLREKGLCIKLGENARRFVLENFSMDRILNMELLLLEGLIKKGEGI